MLDVTPSIHVQQPLDSGEQGPLVEQHRAEALLTLFRTDAAAEPESATIVDVEARKATIDNVRVYLTVEQVTVAWLKESASTGDNERRLLQLYLTLFDIGVFQRHGELQVNVVMNKLEADGKRQQQKKSHTHIVF